MDAASMDSGPEEETVFSVSTLLFALVTLAVYVLFLKPTTAPANANNNNNSNNANANTHRQGSQSQQNRHQRVLAARRQQQQQQRTPQPAVARSRRVPLSENALEILNRCRSLPPHVASDSNSNSNANASISNSAPGGFTMLSENGLVSHSLTRAASANASTSNAGSSSSSSSSSSLPNKASAQRKERAKILCRLCSAASESDDAASNGARGKATTTTTTGSTNTSTSSSSAAGLPQWSVPAKGSVLVLGVSEAGHLRPGPQRSAIVRTIQGLATHYSILVIVSVEDPSSSNSNSATSTGDYAETQTLHERAVRTLRGGSEDPDISEGVLPSHRVLLSGPSALGRVALVRQVSSNVGLTVDFDPEVKTQLQRFGYEVALVNDWEALLPPPEEAASAPESAPAAPATSSSS